MQFYQGMVELQGISTAEQRAVIEIAQLFGGRWTLPVAAHLVALRPRQSRDKRILDAFKVLSGWNSFSCLQLVAC